MMNKTILDYLRKHSGKYPLEALKRKILTSGYSKRELDEALAFLRAEKSKADIKKPKPIKSKSIKPKPAKKPIKIAKPVLKKEKPMPKREFRKPVGIKPTEFKKPVASKKPIALKSADGKSVAAKPVSHKWLKISGVAGIFMLVFSVLSGFFQGGIISQVLLSVCAILSILFFYGFIVLGKKYNQRLLTVVGWFFIIFSVLFVIFEIALLVFPGFVGLPEVELSIESIENAFSSLLSLAGIYLISFGLLLLLYIILGILFGIGLIKLKQVKYAKVTGILTIIGSCTAVIGIGLIVLLAVLIFDIILLFRASKQ